VTTNNIDKVNQLIPNESLDIADFKNFIIKRKELLKTQLKNMVV
jgi:peptidoglycan hydrolase CwlO-like protein